MFPTALFSPGPGPRHSEMNSLVSPSQRGAGALAAQAGWDAGTAPSSCTCRTPNPSRTGPPGCDDPHAQAASRPSETPSRAEPQGISRRAPRSGKISGFPGKCLAAARAWGLEPTTARDPKVTDGQRGSPRLGDPAAFGPQQLRAGARGRTEPLQ